MAKKIDLTDSSTFSNNLSVEAKFPNLPIFIDKLIREIKITLSKKTQHQVSATLLETTFVKFKQWQAVTPTPTAIGITSLNSLISIESKLALSLVELLLGGGKKHFEQKETGEFTKLEITILNDIFILLSASLNNGETLKEVEQNPSFIGVVHPDEQMVCIELELAVDEYAGIVQFLFPSNKSNAFSTT
jgi:flagellar motor switch protein FliM